MATKTTINVLYGGAGFIGANLANSLINKSQLVIVVDLPGAKNWNIIEKLPQARKVKIAGNHDLVFILNNILLELMNLQVAEFELHFWHLAANSDIRVSSTDASVDFENTLNSTISALKLASKLLFVKKFVFASTSAVYGYQPGIKLSEDSDLKPISNYGVMKLASEYLVQNAFSFDSNVNFYIFRFPNVVGPFLTHGLIFDLKKQLIEAKPLINILGNGNQTKQYMHVDELIEEMLLLIDCSPNSIFNLGPASGSTSVREIVRIFQKVNNNFREVKYGEEPFGWVGDVPNFEFSIEKALDHGVMPRLNSYDSVKLAIEQNRVEDYG